MAGSQGDGDLIAAIYDAIIEPSGWDEVVKRIVEATKSFSGGLYIQMADAAHLSALCNVDPFYADAFVQHYYKINPLDASGAAIPPGEVRAATSITQTESFKVSAYCNEFMVPQGWADVAGVGLIHTPKEFGLLTFQRSPDAIWVESAEWHLLETLAPHLKRACDVYMLLSRARAATDSLGAAVAAAGLAVRLFTLDESLRALFKPDMSEQRKLLMTILGTAVAGLDHLDSIVPAIQALSQRHKGYGVTEANYATVGQALLWTLEQGLGEAFTPAVRDAWTATFVLVSDTMKSAARAA